MNEFTEQCWHGARLLTFDASPHFALEVAWHADLRRMLAQELMELVVVHGRMVLL